MSEMSTGAFAPETKYGTLEYWKDRCDKLAERLSIQHKHQANNLILLQVQDKKIRHLENELEVAKGEAACAYTVIECLQKSSADLRDDIRIMVKKAADTRRSAFQKELLVNAER